VQLINVRVDDRLLHGQVLYNWLRQLEPDVVMIVSADITELQGRLLRGVLPARYDLWLGECGQAAAYLSAQGGNPVSALLLVPDVWQVLGLARARVVLPIVTLGSQGWRPGRKRITYQVSLASDEVEVLKSLVANGLKIVFQALPCDVVVPWARKSPGLA
jgi:PTS system mannose-specific IIB component